MEQVNQTLTVEVLGDILRKESRKNLTLTGQTEKKRNKVQ